VHEDAPPFVDNSLVTKEHGLRLEKCLRHNTLCFCSATLIQEIELLIQKGAAIQQQSADFRLQKAKGTKFALVYCTLLKRED